MCKPAIFIIALLAVTSLFFNSNAMAAAVVQETNAAAETCGFGAGNLAPAYFANFAVAAILW